MKNFLIRKINDAEYDRFTAAISDADRKTSFYRIVSANQVFKAFIRAVSSGELKIKIIYGRVTFEIKEKPE